MDISVDRLEYLFTNNNESPYDAYGYSGGASSATPRPFSSNHHQHSRPVGNPIWSDRSKSRSPASSASTFRHGSTSSRTSYSSNETLNQQALNPGYELPCEFGFAGCELPFQPRDIEHWISHSSSHFVNVGPPLKVICIFCDNTFEAKDGRDRLLNWRARMLHIADHFQHPRRGDKRRPDFGVVQHMWKSGLLSDRDFQNAKVYSERPHGCPDIVRRRDRTPPTREEVEDRGSMVAYNTRREDRDRRRKEHERPPRSYRSSREAR